MTRSRTSHKIEAPGESYMVSESIADRIDISSLTGEAEMIPSVTVKEIPVGHIKMEEALISGPLRHVSFRPMKLSLVLRSEGAMTLLKKHTAPWEHVVKGVGASFGGDSWHCDHLPKYKLAFQSLEDGSGSFVITVLEVE